MMMTPRHYAPSRLAAVLGVTFALLCMTAAPARALDAASGEIIQETDTMADFQLPPEEDAERAAYLGVTPGEPFSISDVDARYLLIQVFSMYCPHCQREAPHMKALFENLRGSDHGDDLKLLGLGVGNSAYEVDVFREKYELPFPLFPDQDFTSNDYVGVVGTPFYVLVDVKDTNGHTVLFSQEGTFQDEDAFLTLLLHKAGLAK